MSKEPGKIYSIRSACAKGFAYASGYGPFKGMAFFENLPSLVRERKKEAWDVYPMKPGLEIDEEGTKWPDVLHCGNPPPSEFFSGKVVDSLRANEIHSIRVTEVPVGNVGSSKLREIPHPAYHALEAEPGISIDYAASGIPLDKDGKPELPRGKSVVVHLDPLTWTGADIFKCSNWQRGGMDLLCTERVKKIAEQEGWTNVEFIRLRVKGVDPFTGKPIQ